MFLIEDGDLALRTLQLSDATRDYLQWLADPEINQYLESRFTTHTKKSLQTYIQEHTSREDTLLLAICFLHQDWIHIGNIKIGPINPHHQTADLGILIGDKRWHGKKLGRRAIQLATAMTSQRFPVRKLTASCYRSNHASGKAFKHAGWVQEGIRTAQFIGPKNTVEDQLLFGKVLKDGT